MLGDDHPQTIAAMDNLGVVSYSEGKLAQAETIFKQTLETRRRVLGPEHAQTLASMGNLANVYGDEKKYAQAEALLTQTVQLQRRVLGAEHPDTLRSMNNLAETYVEDSRLADAEPIFVPTLESRQKVLGPAHPSTLLTLSDLGGVYQREGKYRTAEGTFRRAVQASPDDPGSLNNLAGFLAAAPDHRMRRPAEALELARRLIKLAPGDANNLNTAGLAEVRNGLWDDAIATLKRAVELHKGSDPMDFPFLAMACQGHGDKAEAERNFTRRADLASKTAAGDTDLRMLWGEAAEALGKPGPVPTLPEVNAEPERAMERLKQMAGAGFLKPETLEASADLAPLHGRPDLQALIRELRSPGAPPAR